MGGGCGRRGVVGGWGSGGGGVGGESVYELSGQNESRAMKANTVTTKASVQSLTERVLDPCPALARDREAAPTSVTG